MYKSEKCHTKTKNQESNARELKNWQIIAQNNFKRKNITQENVAREKYFIGIEKLVEYYTGIQ